jgi:hypothetical protein
MKRTTPHQEWDQKVSEFTNTFHTLHTKLGIKDSTYGTSKPKWSFCTSHQWGMLIDMLSKLSRNLSNRTSESSSFKYHNNQSMVKITLTHRTTNLNKTNISHKKTRVTRI